MKGVTGFPLVESWRAAGKPVDFHLLADGGHGVGLGSAGTRTQGWLTDFYRCLDSRGLLKASATRP